MDWQLAFLDDAGRVRDVREARFRTEHNALRWMWIAGGVSALGDDWSVMELRSQERCAARVPAKSLKQAPRGQRRASARVMIVDSDTFAPLVRESLVRTGGYSVAEFFFDNASAEKWLRTHTPDAAIIEVRLWDQSCVAFAKKLLERRIPFIAVSKHSADSPGINPIFRAVPWFEKPVSAAGLQLALACVL